MDTDYFYLLLLCLGSHMEGFREPRRRSVPPNPGGPPPRGPEPFLKTDPFGGDAMASVEVEGTDNQGRQKLCRGDVENVKELVKHDVHVPAWVCQQRHRLNWAKQSEGKHMLKTGASWDQMLAEEDDDSDDDKEIRRRIPAEQVFDDFEKFEQSTLSRQSASTPLGTRPSSMAALCRSSS